MVVVALCFDSLLSGDLSFSYSITSNPYSKLSREKYQSAAERRSTLMSNLGMITPKDVGAWIVVIREVVCTVTADVEDL